MKFWPSFTALGLLSNNIYGFKTIGETTETERNTVEWMNGSIF